MDIYKNLEVKTSQIPNSGKGLYTKVDVKKGERIVEYLGEIITEKELEARAEKDEYGYAFFINKKNCIDAFHTPETLARYANDAKGLTRVKGLRNNCAYNIWKNRGWIIAEKNIKAGEEIFVDYGSDYWKEIKHNMKIDADKLKGKTA
jgi:uncharacterized protein